MGGRLHAAGARLQAPASACVENLSHPHTTDKLDMIINDGQAPQVCRRHGSLLPEAVACTECSWRHMQGG